MTKLLIAFDVYSKEIEKFARESCATSVTLFPLTSNGSILATILKEIKGCELTIVNSAKAIDLVLDRLEGAVSKWTRKVANNHCGDTNLMSALNLLGSNFSAWWLGQIEGKNSLRSDIYLKIAQVNALKQEIEKEKFKAIVLICKDQRLFKSARELLHDQPLVCIPCREREKIWPTAIRWQFFLALALWARAWYRGIQARLALGNITEKDNESPIIISYFPLVDEQSAQNGKYENLYFLPLQAELERRGVDVKWVLMPVKITGYSFTKTLALAAKFKANYSLLVLEQLASATVLFKALLAWLTIRFKARQLEYCALLSMFDIGEELYCPPTLAKELWIDSFYGKNCLEGAIYYYSFKALLAQNMRTPFIVYLCEMLPWEKAFCMAAGDLNIKSKIIGFLHSSIPTHFFSYTWAWKDDFHTPHNLIPYPTVIAAGGEGMKVHFEHKGFTNVVAVEALRYFYRNAPPQLVENREPTVLFIGAYKSEENIATLYLINELLPRLPKNLKIFVRPHPSCPILLDEKMGRQVVITDVPLPKLLEKVSAVIVGSSSVALEAFLSGRKVITPIFCDVINMSPLDGLVDYEKVYNATELEMALTNLASLNVVSNKGAPISNYWELDRTLGKWLIEIYTQQSPIAQQVPPVTI